MSLQSCLKNNPVDASLVERIREVSSELRDNDVIRSEANLRAAESVLQELKDERESLLEQLPADRVQEPEAPPEDAADVAHYRVEAQTRMGKGTGRPTSVTDVYQVREDEGAPYQASLFDEKPLERRVNLKRRVALVRQGTVHVAFEKAERPEQIAHIVAPFRRQAQENLVGVVTDAQHKVLAVLRHSLGSTIGAVAELPILLGSVHGVSGAKNLWMAHNHPSGGISQSTDDKALTKTLGKALKGTGIKFQGMMTVAPSTAKAQWDPGTGTMLDLDITPGPRRKPLPVLGREFRKLEKLGVPVSDTGSSIREAKRHLGDRDGVLLLNVRLQVVGSLDMSGEDMGALRMPRTDLGAGPLWKAIHETNAKSVIVQITNIAHQGEAENVARFARAMGMFALDIIAAPPGEPSISLAQAGITIGEHQAWMMRPERIEVAPEAGAPGRLGAGDVQTAIDPMLSKWSNHPPVEIVATTSALPPRILDFVGPGEVIEGVHWGGTVYIVADQVRSAEHAQAILAHEAIGHHSMQEMLGDGFESLLKRVQTLKKTGNRRVNAWAKQVRAREGETVDERTEAAEILALMAESRATEKVFQPIIRRVRELVRAFLRRLGFTLEFSDSELDTLITRAGERLRATPQANVEAPSTLDGHPEEHPLFSRGQRWRLRRQNWDGERLIVGYHRSGRPRFGTTRHPSVRPRNALAKFMKRHFQKEGLLPPSVFARKIEMEGMQADVGVEEEFLATYLRRAIRKSLGRSYANLEPGDRARLNDALTEMDTALPRPVFDTIEAMRGHLDTLSREVIRTQSELIELRMAWLEGARRDKTLQAINDISAGVEESELDLENTDANVVRMAWLVKTITGNLGKYMNRAYQVFDDPKWEKKIRKDEAVMGSAREFFRDELLADQERWLDRETQEQLEAEHPWQEMMRGPGSLRQKAERREEYREEIRARLEAERGLSGEDLGAMADARISTLLAEAAESSDLIGFLSRKRLGEKDLGILRRRKDIPKPIRDLLGEYQDPAYNYTRSASKMAQLVFSHDFLMGVRGDGMGLFLSRGQIEPFTRQIKGRDPETMTPLTGLWVHKDFHQALEEAVGPKLIGEWYRAFVAINAGVKFGKAQPLDATVYTPNGPRVMGDLRVGDMVCSINDATTVLGIYPQGEQAVYTVRFADGAETEATDEHLWEVIGPAGRERYTGIFTTREIGNWPEKVLRDCSVPLGKASYNEREVPLDPYLTGTLIADGCLRGTSVRFSTPDRSILNAVVAGLPDGHRVNHPPSWAPCDHSIVMVDHHTRIDRPIKSTLSNLRLWGKLSHEKFIPDCYKYNSESVRMELLRGLLDGDGWVMRDGQPAYATASERLARDIREVAESLGATVLWMEKTVPGHRLSYNLKFRVANAPDWFSVPRKRASATRKKKPVRRMFRAISFVGHKPCQCIRVQDPSSLYLTDRHIATHNTVLSPITTARNFMSAGMFTMLNGHFNWGYAGKAFGVTYTDFFKRGNVQRWRPYIKELIELGVLHSGVRSEELLAAAEDVVNLERPGRKLTVWGYDFSPVEIAKTVTVKFPTKLYRAGDDVWKIIGWENEIDSLMKHRDITREQAKPIAAERIRNGYPTYSHVPRSIRLLRRFPLVGPFVSFPWEIMRTTTHQYRFAKEDWQAGAKTAVARRALGWAIAGSAFYAISRGSMHLLGIDDEDDEAHRAMGPRWGRNSQFMYYRGVDGQIWTLDLSHLDPYTYLKTPLKALINNNNEGATAKLVDSISELLAPFLGIEITTGAIWEVIMNESLTTGRPLWNERLPEDQKLKAAFDHLRRALQPGVISQVENVGRAFNEYTTPYKKYSIPGELATFVGFRFTPTNAPVSLQYRAYEFVQAKKDTTTILSYPLRSWNEVSQSRFDNAWDALQDSHRRMYDDMGKMVRAARALDVSDQQIHRILRLAGVSQKDVNFIMRNKVPDWKPSRQFLDKAQKMAMETAKTPEDKARMRDQFRERRRMVWERTREESRARRAAGEPETAIGVGP